MSKKLYEELYIQGIANAIREKLGGSNTYKVSEMRNAILSIETGGGGLPEGMAMGTFQCTPQNMTKEVSIEHGLGTIPRLVFFGRVGDNANPTTTEIICGVTYNGTYNSDDTCSTLVYYNNTTPNVKLASGKTADTSTNIFLPTDGNSNFYWFANTYRWIAIL